VSLPAPHVDDAPAKVNLTLRVLGRRPDGYHELESLVAFAGLGDRLSFLPGGELALKLGGPRAAQAGEPADNLVLKAARALAGLIPGIELGTFQLDKRLPVAAGLGGGSADAAAALRLLARVNHLAADDPRLYEAARSTGADVPVCLDPRAQVMRGIGDVLSPPLRLPALQSVFVNPGIALATRDVFAGWKPAAAPPAALDFAAIAGIASRDELLRLLIAQSNDLENSAIELAPAIAEVLTTLRALAGCKLARMSGSGATCFALFSSAADAIKAGEVVHSERPDWWVHATALGG
jgi:4-diphosphocytidyl-2-C-methyl-D-erythritol kinase